jgi:glucokinase
MDDAFLAVEIGGTKLQVVLGTGRHEILERRRLTVDPDQGAAGIRGQIEREVIGLRAKNNFASVGVGFGGPIDITTGEVARSHQIGGWSGFPLKSWLGEIADAPVFVDNDANVAALGEAVHGAGAGQRPLFYVTLGSGVGGGLVIDDRIFHGAKPGESEIGHLRLDRAGTIVESRCSGWAIDRRIRDAVVANPTSSLARIVGEIGRGEARFLGDACRENDPIAHRILAELADDLGFALSHVVHLFHPMTIVLGGGLALTGTLLRDAVEAALKRYVMEVFQPGPRIVLSTLGEDVVPIGALILADQGLAASKAELK